MSSGNLRACAPDKDDIRLATAAEMQGGSPAVGGTGLLAGLSYYKHDLNFARIGSEFKIFDGIEIGIDEVIQIGSYRESLLSTNREIDYSLLTTATYVRQQFGNYVALKLYINLFHRSFDTKFGDQVDSFTETAYSGAVKVEFVL